jgi:hypothetical protein
MSKKDAKEGYDGRISSKDMKEGYQGRREETEGYREGP